MTDSVICHVCKRELFDVRDQDANLPSVAGWTGIMFGDLPGKPAIWLCPEHAEADTAEIQKALK